MSHTGYASLINTIIIKIILHTYLEEYEKKRLIQDVSTSDDFVEKIL